MVDYAERFGQSPPTSWQTMPLPALPEEEPLLDDVPASLQGLVAQVHDLASLYWDQTAFGDLPIEDELVAHAVVPFLRALGWPVERIAVKWHYIDVCVFRALPHCPATCYFLVEAKRFGVVRDVVVTDGIRYRMYEASRDFAPVAYANLARLK